MKIRDQRLIHFLVIIFLTLSLSVSLAFNFILFDLGKSYYSQLNLTRLDPLSLETYPTIPLDNRKNEWAERKIVFFGDSRIAHWPQPKIDDYKILNRGVGAQTSTQVLQRYDDHVDITRSDILLLQVGINDLKTIPLFPEQKDKILINLRENLYEITQKTTAQDATVILTTIFPVGKVPIERKLFWSEDIELAIIDINEFISSLEEENVVILDAYSILVGENGKIQPSYSYDLLHLNEAGYEALNQELEQIMIDLSPR